MIQRQHLQKFEKLELNTVFDCCSLTPLSSKRLRRLDGGSRGPSMY